MNEEFYSSKKKKIKIMISIIVTIIFLAADIFVVY